MAMILSISGWSQETVTFGGTSSTSANTSPLPGYYGYHRSAIVYKPEELADMPSTCNITSIAWRMGGTSNAGGNVSIYLKEIADTAIAGSATWDDVLTDATLVYQGSATAAANTWAEFEFDTPYQYQGGNLVVITQGEGCTTSGGCSKSMYYTGTMGSTTATLSSAWTVYQDSSPQASTVALSGWSTKNHNKYDIKLTYLPADGDYCAGVSGLTKSNVLASTATISWNEREDNATIYVQIKTASQDWEDADEYTTTDNYVDLTDLEPNTEYDVRVMADCGSSQSTYRTTSFRTTCLLISEIPQTWDFENTDHGAGTSSYPLPSCWDRITTSTSSLYPYCYSSSTNAHSGTYSLYWYNYYKNSLAILPPIDTEVLPLTDLRLAFYAKISTATTAAKLQVGVMTDPTDSTTFTVVDSLTLTTTHTLYEVDFNEYEGEGNYIALRNAVTGSTYSYIYVDDMELMHIPACTRPDNIAGETTTDGATLTWTSTGENFVLYYKEYGTEEWLEYTDAQATDTGWVMNLTDLTPATYYLFYIKAVCGEDELSTETYIVRTECELLTELPYVCDFETVPPISNPLPVCWTKGTANATYPYSYSTTDAYEGSRALYFYTANYAALPPIDPNAIDLSTTQLTFFARGKSAGYKLQVGVMTDPTNASTFEQVSSITLTSNYELYEIPLSSYEGEGTYVALRDTASNYIYVDNLSLEVIPACSRPSDIAVETAVNSATVSWTSDGDDFEVYYKQKGTNEWQVAANFVQGEAENTWSAEIDDLLEATQYVFYVKATCEGEPRSFDQSFVTRQTPVDLPYETNFSNEDDANRAWLFQNHTSENYWTFGSIGTNENAETIYGMYITNDGTTSTYSHSATRVSAEKLFTTGSEGQLHLEFDVAAGGESTYDYLKVFITPASWTFPASTSEAWFSVNNYQGSADSNIYVLNFSDYVSKTTNTSAATYPYLFNLTTDTVHISQDIFNPNPNGDMKVTFIWRNDGSDGTQVPAVEISNFSISAIECSAPMITVTDITTESATVTLPEGNDYVVEYKLASDDEGAWQSATVTGTTAEITGLENTTQYSVRAAMVCGNEMSEYSEGAFTTLQVAVDMPYATDFSGEEGTGDRAWLFQNHTSVNHWVFGQPTTGHPAMYITNNDTTLVSSYTITSATRVSAEKLFNADGGEQIHLEFDVKSEGEGGYDYLKVFITPASWTFPASATEETYSVRGYSGNAEENIYVLDFSEYASGTTYASFSTSPYAYNLTNGNTIHISKEITNPDPDGMVKVTFMWRNDGSGGTQPAVEISNFAIDNVVCPTPEFTVDTTTITANSVVINLPEEGSYNVAYKPDSDLITEWEEIEDANGAITLSDLDAVTTYIVKVVKVCDEGLSFSTTHSFTTACGAIATLPWTMNFDSETATIPNCWDRANVYSTYPKVTTSSSHYHSASKKLEFHASTTNSIAILPPFVTDLTELQVSFFSQREGTSSGTLTVGYVKDSADTVAFVPVVSYTAASMGNNDYQFFEVPFNQVEIEEGDNPRIAFAYNTSGASSSYYWFIDDITVSTIPACSRPHQFSVLPTSNSATLSWTSTGTDFVVYYKDASSSEPFTETTNFESGEEENTWSITIDGLSPVTRYAYYVKAICGEGDEISSNIDTFQTRCAGLTELPYTCDFETVPTGSNVLPECWNRGAGINYPYSYSTSSAYEGSRALYFYTANYVTLPPVDADEITLSETQLAFFARSSTAGTVLQVGVMTNPTDTSTFEVIDSIALTTTYTYYEFPLSAYEGEGVYVALRNRVNGYIYLDNLSLDALPECSRPTDIAVTELTTNSATIQWTSTGTDFEIYYKESSETEYPVDPIASFEAGEEENTWTVTIDGLEEMTSYDFYITAVCGTEISSFENTFTTLQTATDLPYSTDFSGDEETGDRAWLFTNGTYSNYWAFGSLGTNAGGETVYGMFVTNDGTTPGYSTGSASIVTTEKTFNVGPEGQIHIEFDVQVGGEGTSTPYDYLKVFLAPPAWSEALSSYSYSNSTYAMDFSDYLSQTGISNYPYKLSLTQGNTIHISQDMTNPNPDGVVKLIFLWRNDGSSGTQPAVNISNLSVSAVACSAPAFVTVSNVAARTATVTLPEEGNFVVEYKTAADEDWTEATVVDNVATLTGLTPETSYSVRAASLCGEDQLSSYVTASFTTTVACPAPVVTVSATTANSAIISYTGDAESYELKYKAAAEEDWTTETITENPYTIANLTPSTSYTLELRANCGEEDGMSSAGTASFTTACVAVTDFPYTESFEGNNLGCWLSNPVDAIASNWSTSEYYYSSSTAPADGSYCAYLYLENNNAYHHAQLLSPTFDLSSIGNPTLTFSHIQKVWISDQDTLGLYYRTSTAGEWTYLTSWSSNINTWQNETITLPEPSAEYQLMFLGAIHYGYGIGIDNITIDGDGETPEPVQPTVVTNAATEVSQTSAVLNGAITDEGNQTITARGFEWKLATATDYTTVSATGTTMTATLTGLTANTSYTYRAFATTALGPVYGSELTFTTLEAVVDPVQPEVETYVATNITETSATLNGNFLSLGNQTITAQGFEWRPLSATDDDFVSVNVPGTTTLTYNLTGLTANTNYIYRTFATTALGTVYGAAVTFTTLEQGEEPCTPTSSTVEAAICAGENYEFNGQTYNATGTYTATLVNAAGCDSTVTLNLTVRPENTPIEETVTISVNDLPYSWRGEEYGEFGTYTVVEEDENGCPQEYVLILNHDNAISVVENEYSIALYPNPTSENATLSVKGLNEEATVIVTDQAGRVISTTKLALGQETLELERSKLASGVYYIRIQTANSVRTEKLIRK